MTSLTFWLTGLENTRPSGSDATLIAEARIYEFQFSPFISLIFMSLTGRVTMGYHTNCRASPFDSFIRGSWAGYNFWRRNSVNDTA